jgi:hypothetical protein
MAKHMLDFAQRNFRSWLEGLMLGQPRQTLGDPFGVILREFLGLAQANALRHGQDNVASRGADAQSQSACSCDTFERDAKGGAVMPDFDFAHRLFRRPDEKIQHAVKTDRPFRQWLLLSIIFGISGRKKSNGRFESVG